MENKYHKGIPKELKAQAIRAVWSREKTIAEVCLELGVSKQAYHKWEKALRSQMEKALEEAKPGRRPKEWVVPEDREKILARQQEEIEELIAIDII